MRSFPDYLEAYDIKSIVMRALAEDIGTGDATIAALSIERMPARSVAYSRQEGVICGLEVAAMVFTAMDPDAVFTAKVTDGDRVNPDDILFEVSGFAGPILSAERVALNFIQRLSGIATFTAKFIEAVGDSKIKILETRKTTPGLRVLEKYAVGVGGGTNHRIGLFDGIMIKDSHKRLMGDVGDAVKKARAGNTNNLKIVAEAETEAEAIEAANAGADIVMLDNFAPEDVAGIVKKLRSKCEIELSGGITLVTIASYAAAGPDRISIGALTHSVPALDISLETFPMNK